MNVKQNLKGIKKSGKSLTKPTSKKTAKIKEIKEIQPENVIKSVVNYDALREKNRQHFKEQIRAHILNAEMTTKEIEVQEYLENCGDVYYTTELSENAEAKRIKQNISSAFVYLAVACAIFYVAGLMKGRRVNVFLD